MLTTLLVIAGCMTTNAFAGSGANGVGLATISNQLSKNLRVATSCQGLGQWQAQNVAQNKSVTATVSQSNTTTLYADAPGFAGCMNFSAHNGKSYRFYDDHGKLNYSQK